MTGFGRCHTRGPNVNSWKSFQSLRYLCNGGVGCGGEQLVLGLGAREATNGADLDAKTSALQHCPPLANNYPARHVKPDPKSLASPDLAKLAGSGKNANLSQHSGRIKIDFLAEQPVAVELENSD